MEYIIKTGSVFGIVGSNLLGRGSVGVRIVYRYGCVPVIMYVLWFYYLASQLRYKMWAHRLMFSCC